MSFNDPIKSFPREYQAWLNNVVKASEAETSFVHGITTFSTEDENMDVLGEDVKTQLNDMVMLTTSVVETFVRAISAALSNYANMAVPAQNLQSQKKTTL